MKRSKSPVIQFSTCYYPESDGKPMAESDWHRHEMCRQIELLKKYYAGQRVYVSGALLLYYEQGNPKKVIVPDVFVVKDIKPGDRRFYKTWIERKAPDVVIENTSKKTKKKDTVTKPDLYAKLGVKEFFLFDPLREYLDPGLEGHRLVGNKYERIEPDTHGALVSNELGLRLLAEEGQVVFNRLDTGERLLTANEWLALVQGQACATPI